MPWPHFLPTYDAGIVRFEFLGSSIWISFVHIPCGVLIADVIADSLCEGAERQIHVADDVDRDSVENGEDGEECHVRRKLEEVGANI
jgi:hypothetical protein